MSTRTVETLFQDEFVGQPPSKRLLAYLLAQRARGAQIAGMYCSYAPTELLRAFDLSTVGLCAFANATIEAAEEVLPANLCPLIKSSYGFILKDTCPFFSMSDVVIAETTCDGKKKMFELIADRKPMFVMDLPQVPDTREAHENWTAMIRKLQGFLESTLGRKTTDARIEQEIRDSNLRNRLLQRIFDFAARRPSVLGWEEMYDLTFLLQAAPGREMKTTLEGILEKLQGRVEAGFAYRPADAPRVLVTGCPLSGDSAKVFRVIEEAGGVVVALDSCSGFKPYMDEIEEGSPDPAAALAARYLKIPCSCMTPNQRRLTALSGLIERFEPDVVIDVVLHACHAYNIESHKVGAHVQQKHGLRFLKIITDYSPSDVEQIRTRVEAVLEAC